MSFFSRNMSFYQPDLLSKIKNQQALNVIRLNEYIFNFSVLRTCIIFIDDVTIMFSYKFNVGKQIIGMQCKQCKNETFNTNTPDLDEFQLRNHQDNYLISKVYKERG